MLLTDIADSKQQQQTLLAMCAAYDDAHAIQALHAESSANQFVKQHSLSPTVTVSTSCASMQIAASTAFKADRRINSLTLKNIGSTTGRTLAMLLRSVALDVTCTL